MRLAQIKNTKIFKQLIGFFVAGCISNLMSLSFYIFAYKILNLSIFISSVGGQILGLLFNYALNSRFVFKKRLNQIYKLIYFGYYLLAINIVGISIDFIYNFGINYIISWFICISLATISNFLFIKYFAFKNN